jgi:ribonucleoside-diphosphate reductase beta chain
MMPDKTLQPWRDYQLAKRFAWDPQQLDFRTDARDWLALDDREQDVVLKLLSMFVKGEEAVASELAPLLFALGKLGNLREEEMFLSTQIFDESVHVEFFYRWLEEVVREPVDYAAYRGANYRAIFDDALPAALDALVQDHSPRALARAYVCYHIIVEGMLAETGYHAIFLACERQRVLEGLRQGIENVKRDESRHIAYGIYALQRLLRQDAALLEFVHAELNRLLPTALGIIAEALEPYGEDVPFGIDLQEMTEYAIDQFNKRLGAIERVTA